jgi:hypothetical protein
MATLTSLTGPNPVLLTPDTVEAYITSGRPTLLVHNTRTRQWRKYKIWAGKQTDSFAVYYESTYLGQLRNRRFYPNDVGHQLYPQESDGFQCVWDWVVRGSWPSHVTLLHEGRCGKCHRQLTDQESIARGIGPECRKKS